MVVDGQCCQLFVFRGDGRCRKSRQSILYLVFENTLPKVSFTTVVTAIVMWGYTPVRTTGVLVCLFLCPQEFCNGYLRRGWTYGGETLEDGGPRCPPGHLPFW